jgi:serine/threonine protein kinase
VTKAIKYLHEQSICHRDIKAENVVLSPDLTSIKLIDFGFSMKGESGTVVRGMTGSPLYMPPEMVNRHEFVCPASDIWSLGVLLYRLTMGSFPFHGATNEALFSEISRANVRTWPSEPDLRNLL